MLCRWQWNCLENGSEWRFLVGFLYMGYAGFDAAVMAVNGKPLLFTSLYLARGLPLICCAGISLFNSDMHLCSFRAYRLFNFRGVLRE